MESQQLKFGNDTLSIAVRKDPNCQFYSRLDDIQDIFPGAVRFNVKGCFILFLQDENGNRIGHYLDDIVEVIIAQGQTSLYPASNTISGGSNWDNESFGHQLQPQDPDQIATLLPHISEPASSHNISASNLTQTTIALKPNVMVRISTEASSILSATSSNINSNIAQLRRELSYSTDTQSTHHTHLVELLLQMLQLQAESREHDIEMLRLQVEAKERDEQLQRMQQQNNDRLVVLQRSVDAVLVQNYELHEYPIPRLFVILPEKKANRILEGMNKTANGMEGPTDDVGEREGFFDIVKNWGPKSLFHKKFRLYFLCEYGECSDSNPDMATTSEETPVRLHSSASTSVTTNTKRHIHLAKHEGYELTRPAQFLEQYGPYVLGILQFLKYSLMATSFVAPAVGLLQENLQDVTKAHQVCV
ncbi:hypothetical protein BGX26_008689 [Mortierella sp. AD094]|nr:hypothetical protein BGX26_008689 [Mortierella sp. AD094]